MLLPVLVFAQNITQVEYYIDTDPGFGNGTSVSISAGTDIDLSFTADLSSVSYGFPVLYVRAKDGDGEGGRVASHAGVAQSGRRPAQH